MDRIHKKEGGKIVVIGMTREGNLFFIEFSFLSLVFYNQVQELSTLKKWGKKCITVTVSIKLIPQTNVSWAPPSLHGFLFCLFVIY